MKKIILAVIIFSGLVFSQTLDSIINGDHRSPKNKLRDQYRHPVETLNFFGIKNNMTVVELSPGGGWYQEILAPFLKNNGQYISATYDSKAKDARTKERYEIEKKKFNNQKKLYGKPVMVALGSDVFGKEASADMVLSFRNYHNWVGNSEFEKLRAIYKTLKPGGVLGIIDHRSNTIKDEKGYTCEPCMIKDAEAVGFIYTGSSQINSNSKDKKDYPGGVWNLPPTLSDRGLTSSTIKLNQIKYNEIGESDRYTLKFSKPN